MRRAATKMLLAALAMAVVSEAATVRETAVAVRSPTALARSRRNAAEKAHEAMDHAKAATDVLSATMDTLSAVAEVASFTGKFTSKLGTIGAVLGPVMSTLGAVLSFVMMFLPKPDSPELAYMKKGFSEVNTKLDQVQNSLNTIETKISYVALYQTYKTQFRQKVAAMEAARRRMVAGGFRKFDTDYFIHQCRNHDILGMRVWVRDHIVNERLEPRYLPTILAQGHYDLRLLRRFAAMVTTRVVQASVIHATYESVIDPKGDHKISDADVNDWKHLANQLAAYFKRGEDEIMRSYTTNHNAAPFLIKKIMADNKSLSNWHLAVKVLNKLQAQFPWTKWGIVAAKEIQRRGADIDTRGGGYMTYHENGRWLFVVHGNLRYLAGVSCPSPAQYGDPQATKIVEHLYARNHGTRMMVVSKQDWDKYGHGDATYVGYVSQCNYHDNWRGHFRVFAAKA